MRENNEETNLEQFYSGWDHFYQTNEQNQAWSSEKHQLVDILQSAAKENLTSIKLLDLGCGDGRNLFPWVVLTSKIAALDISPTAISIVKKLFDGKEIDLSNITVGDIENLPFSDNQFNCIQCIDAIPQVINIKAALSEVQRVLEPGGVFGFNVFTPLDCAFGEGEKINENTFSYKNTLFQFFDEDDILNIIPSKLEIIYLNVLSWVDPPHIPFRPYEHTHHGINIILKKTLISD